MSKKLSVVLSLLALTSAASACTGSNDSAIAEPLCKVLKEVVPRTKELSPIGAQTQLIMAVIQPFENDPEKLRILRVKIDDLATKQCPQDRQAMLDILKMSSLDEAVR